jgi:hypothetical protein
LKANAFCLFLEFEEVEGELTTQVPFIKQIFEACKVYDWGKRQLIHS